MRWMFFKHDFELFKIMMREILAQNFKKITMKKFTEILPIIILLSVGNKAYAQAPSYDLTVPFYIANLIGRPASAWIASELPRVGHPGYARYSDKLISLRTMLASVAAIVNFSFISATMPSCPRHYQADHYPSIAVGSPISFWESSDYLTICTQT